MTTKSIPLKLDFRSGIPIYVQLMDQIRQLVASGELKPGDQLPTVRQLATELRVNWNTVARAYKLLDEAGLISTQQGRGTYIWEQPSPAVAQALRQEALEGIIHRCVSDAARLGYSPAEIQAAFQETIESWKTAKESDQTEKKGIDHGQKNQP